ncbi:Proliferation-associated protein 2G4 [Nowakowskiella sp. JEL0078]|nr:Proliferation-associated protein 2G4 [Nowakowskiella sp. JEL0078]
MPRDESDVEDTEDEKVEINENELSPNNVTKYKLAADIASRALKNVVDAAVDGSNVLDLCKLGDKSIEEETKAVFNKPKGITKGIAFPTCVSPNSFVCHLSPLNSDPESSIVLKKGDIVRIELGAHIDGYIGQVATTIVIGASKEDPITGRKADVIQAAYLSIEAAIRLLKPGRTNWEITDAVQKVSEDFDCKPVEGMLSHQVLRNKLDGKKQIILSPPDNIRKEADTYEFEEGEAYTLDILVSSGDGKARTPETRTTVYKRTEESYNLKMKTSRAVFKEINTNFGMLAFSLRQLEDENKARLAVGEMLNHDLLLPYNILQEKDVDTFIAHFMFTVLIMPNGPLKITQFPWDQDLVKSEKELQNPDLVELLKSSVKNKKKKAKKVKEDK